MSEQGRKVSAQTVCDGRVLRLSLADPPRNVIDRAMLRELREAAAAASDPALKAMLLTCEGPNFSYGASVAEHTRALAPAMLAEFDAAVRALLAPGLPIVAAVRGQCLGGGLEIALLAMRIFAGAETQLGQPEIKLGALAPWASALLPRRVGQARAEELLLSGRIINAPEAARIGLVDEIGDADPEAEALGWVVSSIVPHSAASLRIACRAARGALEQDLETHVDRALRLYKDELLATEDADEGVRAFLEKRAPRWVDR